MLLRFLKNRVTYFDRKISDFPCLNKRWQTKSEILLCSNLGVYCNQKRRTIFSRDVGGNYMSIRYRFYMLIACSLIWFIFGTLKYKDGLTQLDNLAYYEGKLTNIGTTLTTDLKGRSSDIMYFNLNGLNQTLGIYHNTKADYDYYLSRIHKGDLVKVYFNESGYKADNVNLHVYQLEHGNEVLFDSEHKSKTDRKVGLILYCVGLIFSIAPIWFYLTKVRNKTTANNS